MSLSPGAHLGPYEILAPLGAGGMGEVYRARDIRLDRIVAVKILPDHFSENPRLRQRFEREAKALSSLSHPHICTLHDVGESNGVHFLVMEYLEGETLAERLDKGPLPSEKTLRYAMQIADALDTAHRQGVVHRDLKPGNIVLTKTGAKLLDFGLAKSVANVVTSTPTQAPTRPMNPLTEEGTLVGTMQYMAPEQLEGLEVDARTDIFAFGAVLHEMATGQKAFRGKSRANLIAAILSSEPPSITQSQPLAPPALDRLVRTCLTKDPLERWQSARDLMVALQWIAEADSVAAGGGVQANPELKTEIEKTRRRERFLWLAVAALVVTSLLPWLARPRTGRPAARATGARFEVQLPALIGGQAVSTGLALSPVGDILAYAASPAAGGPTVLWLRELGDVDPRPIPGTEAADNLFWSPDGHSIGYVQDGAIKVADLAGGPPRTLARGKTFGPPSWGTADVILYSPAVANPRSLFRVPATGGEPQRVTQLDPTQDLIGHVFPHFLPDGRRFLYLALPRTPDVPVELYLGSLDGEKPRRIEGIHSRAEYASGWLFYCEKGTLMTRRFDPDRAMLQGDATAIGQLPNANLARTGAAEFSVAPSGALAFGSDEWDAELLWLDRSGAKLGQLGEPGPYGSFRISPTGDRVAVAMEVLSIGDRDLWIFDVARGVPMRLAAGFPDDTSPVWSRDGRSVAYSSDVAGAPAIYIREADGSGQPSYVGPVGGYAAYPSDWSRDGTLIAYETTTRSEDTRLLPIDGKETSQTYLEGPGDQIDARFSPDGRWVVFVSSELGSRDVFVAPLADGNVRHRVSAAGGANPVWSPDGRQLYYTVDSTVFAASFSGETAAIGEARELFSLGDNLEINRLDITPDGERFLAGVIDREKNRARITVVLDWDGLLEP